MAEQFSIPTVGDLIAGKYRVEEELGRGAYGVVFRADQEELGRHVAVKTLLPQAFLQQDIVQRFHREAQLISRLAHPNIIRLWDYGVDEGLLYMAVEYVQGRTLMDVIDNDAPIDPERTRAICLQILDALVHAHEVGIVHRDLKPENIVLLETKTTDGREYEVVKILDFGISKLLSGENDAGALKSLTQDGTVLGTPHYMSPENIVGDSIDHRADLYAFGIILFELLTGAHPFDAPSPSAVMVRHLRDELPELPAEIAGTPFGIAIVRCLEKQPLDRIGSAEELIEILEAEDASEVDPIHRRPSLEFRGRIPADPDATVVEDEEKERSTTWYVAGILVVALIVVGIGYNIYREAASATAEPQPPRDQPTVTTPTQPPPPLVAAKTVDAGSPASPDFGRSGVAMVFGPTPVEAKPDAGTSDRPPRDRPPKDGRDGNRPTTTETKKPPKKPPPKPVAPTTVELDVTSVPVGANVTIDGAPVGSTPLAHSFEIGRTVEVRFSHIGYKEKVLKLTPAEDAPAIEAELKKDHLRLVD